MSQRRLPGFLQSAIWSYDLAKLNPEASKDRRLIISHVLNHGTDTQVKWLLKEYSPVEIKKILKRPQKGFWFPESLNYWTQIFNVKLDRQTRERAIKTIYPQA